MDPSQSLLDELASGEDEFDVDLMACGCRLVASPAGREDAVTIRDFIREHPALDEDGLTRLVELLVDETDEIDDRKFLRAVDRISKKKRPGT